MSGRHVGVGVGRDPKPVILVVALTGKDLPVSGARLRRKTEIVMVYH